MSDCIFCKIIAGEIPSRKIYEVSAATRSTTSTPRRRCTPRDPQEHITGAEPDTEENAPLVRHIFAVIAKVAAELGAATTTASSPTAAQGWPDGSATCISTCWPGRDMTWPPG